jgi:hypothetical protein
MCLELEASAIRKRRRDVFLRARGGSGLEGTTLFDDRRLTTGD